MEILERTLDRPLDGSSMRMGLLDIFRRKEDLPPVFYGSVREADLVLVMLESAGFHPYECADISHAHAGAIASGAVIVPPEELEEARAYLDEVMKNAGESDWGRGVGEPWV